MYSYRERILNALESMIADLQRHIEDINNLNVFPVPDGDTGSNMFSTVIAAWNNIQDTSDTDLKIMEDFSNGALLGARGNSGVITSQIIRGFYEGFKIVREKGEEIDNPVLTILKEVKKYAYKAVSKPVEGTILSVTKYLSENYKPEKDLSIAEIVNKIYTLAKEATKNTPEQLEILKKSGVVDSGAYGLTVLISGLKKAIDGRALKINTKGINVSNEKPFFKANPDVNIGYCTELFLTLREPQKFRKSDFLKKMQKLGDSIVLIKDKDILKLHIHAKNPGSIFNEAQKYGEFSMTKAENMASQVFGEGHEIIKNKTKIKKNKNKINFNEQTLEDELNINTNNSSSLNEKELGIVVVSNGIGLDNEFAEIGADVIISGGQTMNPSVQDFVQKIEELNYKNILLLPNNSNIILTVDAVKKTIKDKNIFILPTKSLAQGLVALYNINKEMIEFEEFSDQIISSFESIIDGEITIANRDTELDNLKIKKGDFISIANSKIISNGKKPIEVAKKLIDYIISSDKIEILNILYNEEVGKEEIVELEKYVKIKNKNLEINARYGGQSIYSYIIFGE